MSAILAQKLAASPPTSWKNMNLELGKWIAGEGFGGVFPWTANYDSIEYNNSLVEWLYKGLTTR